MGGMDKPDAPPPSGVVTGETSVVTALPTAPGAPADVSEGKTERLAVMRHELAELQLRLTEAQQRIAAELQGRAEDADRIEDLEERVQAQDSKAREDAARIAELGNENTEVRTRLESSNKALEELRVSLEARDARIEELDRKQRDLNQELEAHTSALGDLKTQLAARDAELAVGLANRESEQAARKQLESELEALVGKHREVTEQLETRTSALRETRERLAEREAALTATTSERNAHQDTSARLESELQETRRALEAGRARAQELAQQITSLGQGILDTVVADDPRSAQPARSAASGPAPTKPPPIPIDEAKPRPAMEAPPLATAPRSRTLPLILGMAVGAAVSLAVVRFAAVNTGSDSGDVAGASQQPDTANPPPPSPSFANPVADQSAQPASAAQTDSTKSPAVPPADAQGIGIVVLPPEAEGRRVFVDGHRLEPKNGRLEIPCGTHEIQIGSKGEPRAVDVACVGETEIR